MSCLSRQLVDQSRPSENNPVIVDTLGRIVHISSLNFSLL
jgi:hypothetical protein